MLLTEVHEAFQPTEEVKEKLQAALVAGSPAKPGMDCDQVATTGREISEPASSASTAPEKQCYHCENLEKAEGRNEFLVSLIFDRRIQSDALSCSRRCEP